MVEDFTELTVLTSREEDQGWDKVCLPGQPPIYTGERFVGNRHLAYLSNDRICQYCFKGKGKPVWTIISAQGAQ